VFILLGLTRVSGKDTQPSLFTLLPHGLFVMATLVAVLQPEFNLREVLYLYNEIHILIIINFLSLAITFVWKVLLRYFLCSNMLSYLCYR